MADNIVKIKINGAEYKVKEGETILNAAKLAGIDIPTICYLKDVSDYASCGVCIVEVKNAKSLLRSCITKVYDGMEIQTNTARVQHARRINIELLLASHPQECLTCDRNETCELRRLAYKLGVHDIRFQKGKDMEYLMDVTSLSVQRDPNKCILCHRCVAACANIQSVYAIDLENRGIKSKVTTFMDKGLGNVECVNCGQCILACPTGAITEKTSIPDVWKAINDPNKVVLVEVAPAVRASIGEEFGMPAGSLVTGKMTAALRKLGFDKVFDTQFTADLTIMEEGHELIDRLTNKGTLPLITSCSPGWVKFVEHFYPSLLKHVSSCKSPQQMFGSIAKTFYAEKMGIDPKNVIVVSVMPCTAKKFECKRPEMKSAFEYWKKKGKAKENEEYYDVDYILTTREASRMIKEAGINFVGLPDEEFDLPLGVSTGAAVIFGATGGVMEAALRTAYEVVTKKPLEKLDFEELRGFKGIKTAEVDLNGTIVKVAAASGLSNARKLLEQIAQGKSPYHFIEIMACPGGCLGGGGQPIPTNWEIRGKRAEAIYREDKGMPLRKSHENPEVQILYKEFLEKPLGHMSHELLHTHYEEKPIYK